MIKVTHDKPTSNIVTSSKTMVPRKGLEEGREPSPTGRLSQRLRFGFIIFQEGLISRGFTGGSVVKNLPANAGDMRLIPGPRRSHVPWSSKACACQY